MVSSTPHPHFTPGIDPVPIVQETGWAPEPVWTGGNLVPTGIRSRTVQPVAQSLYRLSYPALFFHTRVAKKHKGDQALQSYWNANCCAPSSRVSNREINYFSAPDLRFFFRACDFIWCGRFGIFLSCKISTRPLLQSEYELYYWSNLHHTPQFPDWFSFATDKVNGSQAHRLSTSVVEPQ